MSPSIDPLEQFFSMFAQANAAVWPLLLMWNAAAIAAVRLAITPTAGSNRLIASFLGVYYIWLGIVFFDIFYNPINDHALASGAMFVLGGALWIIAGVMRQDLRFHARWDINGVTGGVFILYALTAYPVIGMLSSHFYPATPLFGLAPCPSVIFTAGLLLWSRPRLPLYVLVVPLFWLLAQTPAEALAVGVVADLVRPLVGIAATALLIWRDYASSRERLFGGGILALGVICLGHDDLLMVLGSVFLLICLVRWWIHRAAGIAKQRSIGATFTQG